MKRILLLFASFLLTATIHAQFEIDSIGRVNVRNPTNRIAQMNIESPWVNIQTNRNGTGNNNFYTAYESFNWMTGNGLLMAIRGVSHGSGGSQNCGVFGMSLSGGANKDFGVIGSLYSTSFKGAGVYGTNRWMNDPISSTTFSKAYAGYFDGDLHTQGNITYSGTLTGGVLLTSLPGTSSSSSETQLLEDRTNDEAFATSKLANLSLQTYYHPVPETRNTTNVPEFWGLDSLEIANMKEMPRGEEPEDIIADQILSKKHYTLDAAQLEEAFPDLVYDNEDGTKSINYVEMVPILVQAIKELSAKVEALEGNKEVKKNKKTTSVNIAESVQVLSLGQNKPNPFSRATDIDVYVPETVQTAFLYVYDLQGKKVQQVDITARGKQTVSVNAAVLAEGMYLYSLIADGKVVETRRMIAEK